MRITAISSTAIPTEGQIDASRITQKTPAKPVDGPHHRIQRVEEPEFRRHNTAAETDRRNIQSELDNKRHDNPKISDIPL